MKALTNFESEVNRSALRLAPVGMNTDQSIIFFAPAFLKNCPMKQISGPFPWNMPDPSKMPVRWT
jgi:hypothetical protein